MTSDTTPPLRLYLLAGEASGDRLGAALMRGLKSIAPDVEFRGVAGPMMQEEGMVSLFPMSELSVMGIAEVLPRYPALVRRLNEAAEDVIGWRPDALVTIDSPDFSLRLAKQVKESADIPTIHYVAPSVWAWRPGRAEKMARSIDHVLALLPFEPPLMEAAGMSCDFVGHPVVAEPVASAEDIAAFRSETGLGEADVLLVLPGSRRTEIERLQHPFGEALKAVVARHPDLRVVVPAAPGMSEVVARFVRSWPGDPVVIDTGATDGAARKRAAFRAARLALAASGTVSLELAATGTPMVIAYDMNWLSWKIMSNLARVDTVTLVNLVSEFLGPACKPGSIAGALESLLSDDAAVEEQRDAMRVTMERLGKGGEAPGHRAAASVLKALDYAPRHIQPPPSTRVPPVS